MGLHKDFPESPHAILDPSVRWFPADETLRETTMDKLMPPLVPELRKRVKEFRDSGYSGATVTSQSLLNFWFKEPHLMPQSDGTMAEFQYYFAQREALETVVYLYDVLNAKDKWSLMPLAPNAPINAAMFDENWSRYVIKMATGAGKTKVLSLAIAWSFFCKTYEPESTLSRNFLVIAPNIIVLDRIYRDFKGLDIFLKDPVIPDNGYDGRNWRDDFQLTLHIQDEVRVVRPTGNIFLTNIHRVYSGDDIPASADDDNTMDYFLGPRPTGATTDSKVDLGMIVRDIDELMVLNDEAHHIHNKKLAWFKSIEDISNRLKQKGDQLSLQIDVTATPRHDSGAIFVQTISDYPLVEAIRQNVVKHPTIPDKASQDKLEVRPSAKFTEKYADFLDLGVIEWRKAYEVNEKQGKKSVLFVMTEDTITSDETTEYLEKYYPDLKDAVLVIHTKDNGDYFEKPKGKDKDELEKLREQANAIDTWESPYKAVVSVLMLKEGWDVRNVTTIVGLRQYTAPSFILPEQTLGRGLRKMLSAEGTEYLSVLGTPAFMEFVERIEKEGVDLERKPMGTGGTGSDQILIEVDETNEKKNLDDLDIEIPVMTPRIYREYKNLAELDVTRLGHQTVIYQEFSEEQQREIIFKDITTNEITHTTVLDTAGIVDYRSVIGYFTQTVMKGLRLFSGYDVLYPKVKAFVQDELFGKSVELEHLNTIRNLSEMVATKTVLDSFTKAINELTVRDKGDAEIRDTIKLRNTRPFVVKNQAYLTPKKSVFNRMIGDKGFELKFGSFLDGCDDILSFTKNFQAVGFKLDYVKSDGSISNYIPDFFVKVNPNLVVIVETKGLEELELPQKMARLKQWCEDINNAQSEIAFDFAYVDEASFHEHRPKRLADILEGFRQYKS
jgi:type III restriction enzyme